MDEQDTFNALRRKSFDEVLNEWMGVSEYRSIRVGQMQH